MPYRKIKVKGRIGSILHLLSGQRVITDSSSESLGVWDLETGTQVEEWEVPVKLDSTALSPDGKTLAIWSWDDGAVKLWSIDTGKVTKTLTGHAALWIDFVCWSPDGGRVLVRSIDEIDDICDGTFRVWDVKSGETILGPIKISAGSTYTRPMSAHYSPDGKMIATLTRDWLKIWDGNTGKLLKTHQYQGFITHLAWTSNGKTLSTWRALRRGFQIMKLDTATWTVLDLTEHSFVDSFSSSPDGHSFAATSLSSGTVQLWNIETNQPICTPLHHELGVHSGTFSADGKFLITSCEDRHIYIWDVSAILKEVALHSPAPKMTGTPRIPPGFFDDALREANLRVRLSQSHGPHNQSTPTPRQHTLSPFWRRLKSHGEIEHHTRPLSHSLHWTRNLVSGMLRRRDGSDNELREIEVPCTAGKPRNYHARKRPTARSSRPPKMHTTQKPNASSSQLPPTATASTLSAVTGTAEASGTPSRPHIIGAAWRARFVGWICCMPIQNADGHH